MQNETRLHTGTKVNSGTRIDQGSNVFWSAVVKQRSILAVPKLFNMLYVAI